MAQRAKKYVTFWGMLYSMTERQFERLERARSEGAETPSPEDFGAKFVAAVSDVTNPA